MLRWGVCATILAAPHDILRFAAHHLDAGAHRLYLYLDAQSAAFDLLKAHPRVRPVLCDAAHWKKLIGQRPERHQVRQMLNATHAYHRRSEVDWLAHIDVDEFIIADDVASTLSAVSPKAEAARMRPMENLGGSETTFKAWIPPGPDRAPLVRALYPTFGAYLKGGFLSHLAGKVFVRTRLHGLKIRIHDAFRGEGRVETTVELPDMHLAHLHAKTWAAWRAHYDYRLTKGSYRAELAPGKSGMTMHQLFRFIQDDEGEAGLRRFFAEVAEDSPDLRARLAAHGLLRQHDLALDAKVTRHFPGAQV